MRDRCSGTKLRKKIKIEGKKDKVKRKEGEARNTLRGKNLTKESNKDKRDRGPHTVPLASFSKQL